MLQSFHRITRFQPTIGQTQAGFLQIGTEPEGTCEIRLSLGVISRLQVGPSEQSYDRCVIGINPVCSLQQFQSVRIILVLIFRNRSRIERATFRPYVEFPHVRQG